MKKSIGLIVFYCCTFLLVAQHPYLRHFTVENGLPSSFIYHIFQDSKQFIWVATDKGVAHYDGYSFKIYDTNNGLPNNDVWSFFEDSQGRVWICSYMTHFAYYDYHDHKFHVIKNPNPETTSKIINYGFEIDGKVLFSDNRYGLVVEPQQGKIITKSQTQWRSDAKKQVYCLENNTLGIKLYNQTSPIHHLQTKPINWFIWGGNRHFLYFNKDSIWYDTPKGNYLKLVHQLSQSKDNYFSQLFPISHEKLLVVTKSDFFIIDSQLNRLCQYDFLKQYNVQTITEDNEKNIWVATKNDGVFLLTADVNHSQTWDLTKFNPPISNQVRAITSDTQGRVWLGTEDGNILYLKENVLQPLYFSQPNTQYIRSLCLFQENKLVACTNDYLSFVDIANIETYLGK